MAGECGTPLHHTIVHGHVSTVKAMLKAGCPVDVVDRNGATVLHVAAQARNAELIKEELIKEVLSTGCDINVTLM